MSHRKSDEFNTRRQRSDFPRPDAEQAKQGAPEHERAPGDAAESAKRNDDAHGYSQDSGYGGSGGYGKTEEGSGKKLIVQTQKPGNGHTHSDEQIRAHIQQRLMGERAPRASHLLVSVGQGVVTLRGEVDDEAERKRLIDLVRGVDSVRELHDELSTRAARHDVN